MSNYIDKYNIKMDGLKLEKEDPHEAIKFYKDLLNHEYFQNDYYPYRRLVLMYKKTKQFDKKVNIIRCFFKSGIYCNRHNYLWFRNKLRKYSEKGYISATEITELTDYFKINSCKNKDKSDIPMPIADRIVKKRGEITIDSQERYDARHKAFELEEEGRELKRQGRIKEFIKLYNHMIDDLGYRSYSYFKALCVAYRQINDLDNELRIIDKYFNGESTRTRLSNEWFENREAEVLKYLNVEINEDDLTFDKLFNDDEYIKDFSENAKLHDEISILKKQIDLIEKRIDKLENINKTSYVSHTQKDEKEENIKPLNNLITIDFQEEAQVIKNHQKIYDYEIKLDSDLKINSNAELYEYDETLSEVGNIIRKYLLKKRGLSLRKEEAIRFFKYLTKNSYFENDWYPYRQITIIYDRTGDYKLNLENIKEVFLSGVYLNKHQFVWFTNKLRKISNHILLDENQVNSWIEFYNMNGAKNKDKMHKPVVNADAMTTKGELLKIFTKEHFDIKQKRYEIRETCRMLESIENYQREFDVIKEYYHEFPESRMNNKWYNDKLKKINEHINTNYTIDDLKLGISN